MRRQIYLRFLLHSTFLILITSIVGSSTAVAGKYVLVKREIPESSYRYSDVPGGVCEAFEKNLQHFSNEQYGMACGRKLDPKLGFSRPSWKSINPWKYQSLMKDINRVQRWNRPPNIEPDDWNGLLKSTIDWGMVVELTRIDIDGDGKPENLIRNGKKRSCDPKVALSRSSMTASSHGRSLLVADANLMKVQATFLPPDDVILYRGEVYSDALGRGHQLGQTDASKATLFLYQLLRFNAGVKCIFNYYESP